MPTKAISSSGQNVVHDGEPETGGDQQQRHDLQEVPSADVVPTQPDAERQRRRTKQRRRHDETDAGVGEPDGGDAASTTLTIPSPNSRTPRVCKRTAASPRRAGGEEPHLTIIARRPGSRRATSFARPKTRSAHIATSSPWRGRAHRESSPMALDAYLRLVGSQQGQIKGSVTRKGLEHTIRVTASEHHLERPFDAATGQATGARRTRRTRSRRTSTWRRRGWRPRGGRTRR